MGHIYENCYKLVEDVRQDINEYTAEKLAGTDTSGQFSNAYIVTKINAAQRFIHAALMKFIPEEFATETTIVGVNSVYTLPWDYGSIIQFEDEQGRKVLPSNIKFTPITGNDGSDRLYYQKGRTFVLNQTGVTETYTLKYYTKPRDLNFGQAVAGSGAGSLYMATTAKAKADYYNGVIFENFTAAFEGECTDFVVANYEASIPGTWTTSDWYGTVSEIPEEFHFLIPFWTVIVLKEHPASQEKPTKKEYTDFQEMFSTTLAGFTGQKEDIDATDIWCDFGPIGRGVGYDVPGQGYLIG
jgi:hypothetical protein